MKSLRTGSSGMKRSAEYPAPFANEVAKRQIEQMATT